MIFNNSSRLQLSFLIYLIIISIVLYIKPKFIYNNKGKLRPFGCGRNNTIFPLWLIILLTAFLSYYISQIILFANFIKTN
jgi:hypothetical protein